MAVLTKGGRQRLVPLAFAKDQHKYTPSPPTFARPTLNRSLPFTYRSVNPPTFLQTIFTSLLTIWIETRYICGVLKPNAFLHLKKTLTMNIIATTIEEAVNHLNESAVDGIDYQIETDRNGFVSVIEYNHVIGEDIEWFFTQQPHAMSGKTLFKFYC